MSLGSFSCLLYFASHTNAVEVLKFAKQSNTQYIGSENVFAVNYMGPVLETIGNVLIREVSVFRHIDTLILCAIYMLLRHHFCVFRMRRA